MRTVQANISGFTAHDRCSEGHGCTRRPTPKCCRETSTTVIARRVRRGSGPCSLLPVWAQLSGDMVSCREYGFPELDQLACGTARPKRRWCCGPSCRYEAAVAGTSGDHGRRSRSFSPAGTNRRLCLPTHRSARASSAHAELGFHSRRSRMHAAHLRLSRPAPGISGIGLRRLRPEHARHRLPA